MRSLLSRTWIRIAVSYALLVLLTVGVLAFLLAGEFDASEEAALKGRLADQARAVGSAATPILEGQDEVTSTNVLANLMAALFSTRVTIIKPDGKVVGDS